jgi:hypothetical protein
MAGRERMERSNETKGVTVTARGFEATTTAVIAGDQAHLARIADGGGWERRGLLQRLARSEDASENPWRPLRVR